MGMQPAARFFDEAARNRDRVTVMADATPVSSFGVNFTLFYGKDDYQGADAEQEFGLLDNKNTGWTLGANYAPNGKVNVGADYGRETYNACQASRNANPAPDPSWTDPNRDWTLTNDEKVNTFTAYVNLVKAFANTDIRASYDLMDSDQSYTHGGPRIASLSAAGQFVPFPNVTDKWQRATIDVNYSFSKKLGVGASYWYEKLDMKDYATINTAGPQTLPRSDLGAQTDTARIDWLGTITTGYAARPYKGQTLFLRLFYLF
jgi:Putative outer membrane beta-barrel porin, MtrB/PioB